MSSGSRKAIRLEGSFEYSKDPNATEPQSLDTAPKMSNEYFGNAYQKGFPLTLRFLISRGLSYEVALDTAQAAWARAWEKRGQLRQPTLMLTWTNSIALNLYRTMLRRERQVEPLVDQESSASLNIAAIDVEQILNDCKPNDRAVLEGHYIHGLKTIELAQLEGCSETAIRIRLFRARKRIQSHLFVAKARTFVPMAASLGA